MVDPDLILILTAGNEQTGRAFSLRHNKSRYVAPLSNFLRKFDSREVTPTDPAELKDKSRYCSQLQLTFKLKPKDIQQGFVFGSDPRACDILLGDRRGGISGRHFSIRFDNRKRVLLRDTSSTGTIVSYDRQCTTQKRSKFTWILFEGIDIEVEITETIHFGLMLATHPNCEAVYQQRIDQYLNELRNALGPINMLSIDSQETTAAPTQPVTPKTLPIYYEDELLGQGNFGVVHRAFDVSTGLVYAAKEFFRGPWIKEAEIMKRIAHEHIVRYEFFTEEIKPCLIMEYLPLGNLESQHQISPITEDEYITVLYQGLHALEYMHSQQVAHRDIRPKNILIRSRKPLHVKLADFGLSENTSILLTQGGTCLYIAPEIWSGSVYTAAVDIWSLGLVVYQYAYGLPEYRRNFIDKAFDARFWNEQIIRGVNNRSPDKLINLLSSSMLKTDCRERKTATECLQQVYRLYQSETVLQVHEAEATSPQARHIREQENLDIFHKARSTVHNSSSPAQASFNPRAHADLWSPLAHPTGDFEVIEQRQTLRKTVDRVALSTQEPTINSTTARADSAKSLKLQRHNPPNSDLSLNIQHVAPPKPVTVDSLTQPGYHQITVKGMPVAMRKADSWLNATQVLALTSKPAAQREEIINHFRTQSAAEVTEVVDSFALPSCWVSYRVGRLLCDVLKLRETLWPLLQLRETQWPISQFEHASTLAGESQTCHTKFLPDFVEINCHGALVVMRRTDFRVNCTQILKMAGQSKERMVAIRRTGIPFDMVVGGRAKYQGTYLDMDDALKLCQQYGVNEIRMHLQDAWKNTRPQTISVGDEATARRRHVELGAPDARLETNNGEPHVVTAGVMRADNARFVDTTADGIAGSESINEWEAEAYRLSDYTVPSFWDASFILPFEIDDFLPNYNSASMNPQLCAHTPWCSCQYIPSSMPSEF